MATTERAKTSRATKGAGTKPERGSLYPPGHTPSDDPYYLDDTLDAHPPLRRLFPGKPTPEAMTAAKKLAAERGYPMPHVTPEREESDGDHDGATETAHGAASR